MKKLLCAALLAVSLSTQMLAGEVPFPPAPQPPPPCRQDCGSGLSSTVTTVIVKGVLLLLTYR